MIDARPVFAVRRGAEPEFPVEDLEGLFDLLFFFGDFVVGDIRVLFTDLFAELFERHVAVRALRPDRTVRPDVNLFQFAQNAGANLSGAAADGVERAALVPHLGADAAFAGEVPQVTRFADRAGQRLLRIAVFLGLQTHRRNGGVHVVGGRTGHGVELVPHVGEDVAEVGVFLGVGIVRSLALQGVLVDVAEGHDFTVGRRVVDVAAPLAADAEAGDGDRLQGAGARDFVRVTGSNHKPGPGDGGRLEKVTTCRSHQDTP